MQFMVPVIIVIILVVALIAFVVYKNLQDEKEFERKLNDQEGNSLHPPVNDPHY